MSTKENGTGRKAAGMGLIETLVKSLTESDQSGGSVNAMLNVRMEVKIVIGRARLPLSNLITLSQGAVIELDRRIGDPVDIVVEDVVVARGELVAGNDEGVGVKLTEVVKEALPSGL